MSFLKRVLSADYRRALAAEATGEYLDAARAYALAGEPLKVAEMHLLAAERAGDADGRVAELRAASRWAEGDEPGALALRRRVARALLDQVRATGPVSAGDRRLLAQAARLFAEAGDHAGAGECLELAGDEQAAADAFQEAGEVERLENVLSREEDRRRHHQRLREAFAEFEVRLAAGARDEALARLRECVALEPDGPSRRRLDELEGRILAAGTVGMRVGATRASTLYVGVFPFGLGREMNAEVPLRDSRVSRRHAEVLMRDGRFRVRDCGSRNGTFLGGLAGAGGLPIDGELPLEGEGELGLGDAVLARYRVEGERLTLQVLRGTDRGLVVFASPRPIPIPIDGGAATVRFVEGRPILEPNPGRRLVLNGARAGARVQLLRGDIVDVRGDGIHVDPVRLVVEAEP